MSLLSPNIVEDELECRHVIFLKNSTAAKIYVWANNVLFAIPCGTITVNTIRGETLQVSKFASNPLYGTGTC
jgi:hypothetical protein